jgi:hypothetical protein
MVLDAWEEVPLALPPSTTVTELKERALARARIDTPAEQYLVKFRGAELAEGEATLGDSGVVPNGALIVMPRRRVPVR